MIKFNVFQLEKNRKYAKWKAAYIHNCLKNGETPVAGPIGGDEDSDNLGEFRQLEILTGLKCAKKRCFTGTDQAAGPSHMPSISEQPSAPGIAPVPAPRNQPAPGM